MLSSGTMITPKSHSTRRTAEGLRKVGDALADRGGAEAMHLRIGEEYLRQFGKIAKESTTLIVPVSSATWLRSWQWRPASSGRHHPLRLRALIQNV